MIKCNYFSITSYFTVLKSITILYLLYFTLFYFSVHYIITIYTLLIVHQITKSIALNAIYFSLHYCIPLYLINFVPRGVDCVSLICLLTLGLIDVVPYSRQRMGMFEGMGIVGRNIGRQ